MTKSNKAPRGPSLRDRTPVGQLVRRMIESPETALRQAEVDAATLEEVLRIPAIRHGVVALSPAGLDWVPHSLRRRAASFRAGRDEARKIAAMLDDAAFARLRAHLKANPASAECVIWLLYENRRLSASQAASKAAQRKNAAPREFVAKKWRERTDRGQSKASFARMMADIVKLRFGVVVGSDRIARNWLPKD